MTNDRKAITNATKTTYNAMLVDQEWQLGGRCCCRSLAENRSKIRVDSVMQE